jgi:hypothetical protein
MATLEESFVYQLILLLIGAGVSSLLIPWFTNRLQDHKKKLEIKVDIATKISELIAYQVANSGALLTLEERTFSDVANVAFLENNKKWYIDVKVISSKLESYFPETGIMKRWEEYCSVLTAITRFMRQSLYKAPTEEQEKSQIFFLEHIKNYFSSNPQVDWNRITTEMTFDDVQWANLASLIMRRGDEIIKDILKLPIKVF